MSVAVHVIAGPFATSVELEAEPGTSAELAFVGQLARIWKSPVTAAEIVAADLLHSRCGCNAHLRPFFRKRQPALVECSNCGACWEWGTP